MAWESLLYFAIFAAFKESMTLNLAQRSSKVIDFGIPVETSKARTYSIVVNLDPILHRFRDTAAWCRKSFTIPQHCRRTDGHTTYKRKRRRQLALAIPCFARLSAVKCMKSHPCPTRATTPVIVEKYDNRPIWIVDTQNFGPVICMSAICLISQKRELKLTHLLF